MEFLTSKGKIERLKAFDDQAHLRLKLARADKLNLTPPRTFMGSALLKTSFCALNAFRLAACYKSLLQFSGSNCELYLVIAEEFGGRNVV